MYIITEHGTDVKEAREEQRRQRRTQAVPSVPAVCLPQVKVAVVERGLLILLKGGGY